MTATAGNAFTAAQFNASVRDNLNQTAPAVVTGAGQLIVSTAANAVAPRAPLNAVIATAQTAVSTSYVDLATPGPAVTVTTGASAIVAIGSQLDNNTANTQTFASYAVSGATAVTVQHAWRILRDGAALSNPHRYSAMSMQAALNPGSNTFTMKYAVGGGTGTFANREIVVMPL